MIKSLLLGALAIALLGGLLSLQAPYNDFEEWKREYGIKYNDSENSYREAIFRSNITKIYKHNSNPNRTYNMGVNQFTALNQVEFQKIYLTLKAYAKQLTIEQAKDTLLDDVDLTTDYVTSVNNQGECGSGWAFSATGALEALSKAVNGTLRSFSAQQLIDCSTSYYGNNGCKGGMMNNAFEYVKDRGISLEFEYPDTAIKGTCVKDGGNFRIAGVKYAIGCTALANVLSNNRTVSVAVDATNWSTYSYGIFSNCATSLNHGALLVGSKADAWLVKNSWGSTWGESGYIRLSRGNTCGICTIPSYPFK